MKFKIKIILCLGMAVLVWIMSSVMVLNQALAKEDTNLLFIVVDTLRSDHLGCYGYEKIKTPHIDSLAKNGTLFKNAISQAPLTFPSHSSFFTSTYPQFNHARDNGSYRLDNSAVTLAEIMERSGYATAAFVSTFVLDSKFGLAQGFQTYDDNMDKVTRKRVIKTMDEERKADKVTEQAVNWLRANKDKKFFLWVHYYDPHTVYNPPSPYKETYKDNPYDGEIAFCDEYIGMLLSVLRDLRLDKNTLIVFLSDHGEGFGEHGEFGHGIFLYDSTLKVPLVFSYPGLIPEGKAIEEQVRLIDVMPTVLDFLQIKKNKEIQGTSLAPLINGKVKTLRLQAYSESFYAQLHYNWSQMQSWRTEDWKYIKSTEPELYGIKNDKQESANLVKVRTDIVKDLDSNLGKFLKKTSSVEEEKKIEPDKETKEKLMSLGYIQGAVTPGSSEPVPRKMIQIMEKLNLADRLANDGLVEQAIKTFNEVLAQDANNIDAYIRLAQCYKELEKYDEAIKYFKKAASFKPNDPDVHDGLGNVYKSMGRADAAFEEFQIALLLDPDNPSIMNNIGWYYQQKLYIDKAMEQYQKVIQLDPNIATTHVNMAICYRVKGQLDKAIQEVKRGLELDPELAFGYAELCACIATQGNLDEAIPSCQKSIELDPEGFDGYNNLGVCYERKGEYAKALENYLKALKIAPWNILLQCNIGNVYMQRLEYDQAAEHFKKALEIDPQNKTAAQMLKIISQRQNK